ncbi:MAG: hypothetical protein EHM78_12250 [Myxococcaceae bacterium]|nr:MAG: hypothetical protein EHM78_12250 [Myxococcaceae bacterium]
MKTLARSFCVCFAALALGCGGSSAFQVSSAGGSGVAVTGTPGPTPFIGFLHLTGQTLAALDSVLWTVQPKAGSASKPVSARYAYAALQRRGWVSETSVTVPVFGLYAGAENQVSVELQATDGSRQDLAVRITTDPYEDPEGVYDHPTILQPRPAGSALGFDFLALKPMRASVVVVDTDGQVRWVGTSTPSAATIFTGNGFVVGSPTSTQVARLELDGEVTGAQVADGSLVQFTHNIDPGKVGVLAEFDAQGEVDATVAETDAAGTLLAGWKLGDLLAAYMAEAGDDPSLFVRPGTDWFHLNAATYDPRDDSLIVSSRENFVMKIDYATGHLIWILGDPTKYWAQFPSLRARALTLVGGGLYPIGQHATSITSDGLLMLFNDGTPSVNQPRGAPAGQALSTSAVSAYEIDPVAMTAREVWRFEHQPALSSAYCSSAYEAGQSLLVNYAQADNGSTVRVLGLDGSRQVVFDLAYRNTAACDTSWNAAPVPFDQLRFDE